MRSLWAAVIGTIVLLTGLPSVAVAAGGAERIAASIAGDLVDLADLCQRKSLNEEARRHAAEALTLAPGHTRARKLLEKLEASEGTASETSRKEYERRLARKAPKLCERYLALAKVTKDTAPAGSYGARAQAFDPEGETLPVRVFIGVDDEPALGPLAGDAEAIEEHFRPYAESFARQGLGNVELVLLPGVGHSPCGKEVTDFFAEEWRDSR